MVFTVHAEIYKRESYDVTEVYCSCDFFGFYYGHNNNEYYMIKYRSDRHDISYITKIYSDNYNQIYDTNIIKIIL